MAAATTTTTTVVKMIGKREGGRSPSPPSSAWCARNDSVDYLFGQKNTNDREPVQSGTNLAKTVHTFHEKMTVISTLPSFAVRAFRVGYGRLGQTELEPQPSRLPLPCATRLASSLPLFVPLFLYALLPLLVCSSRAPPTPTPTPAPPPLSPRIWTISHEVVCPRCRGPRIWTISHDVVYSR